MAQREQGMLKLVFGHKDLIYLVFKKNLKNRNLAKNAEFDKIIMTLQNPFKVHFFINIYIHIYCIQN
jgi:hemerythrin